MVKKYIEKIENINAPKIKNLTIDNLGHFNLFSGKIENGYISICDPYYPFNALRAVTNGIRNTRIFTNLLENKHHSVLELEIDNLFQNIKNHNHQIFATTQRYDVIKTFAEVAQKYKDVEANYYRLGRSGRKSEYGRSIASCYEIDSLLNSTNQNIEAR